jgi:hypothetical protein
MIRFSPSLSVIALLALGACEEFDPPPDVKIANIDNGVMLTTPDLPLELEFSEPYVGSSLKMKVVPAAFDSEGNLPDEQSPPLAQEFRDTTLVAYDGARPDDANFSFGATFERSSNRLIVTQQNPFGWSSPLLVLIEPGLEDREGHVTLPRKRLPFTYVLPGGGPNSMPSGYYYFLMNVDYLATQIQVYAYLEVNPETGIWRAIFTNGNRLVALNTRTGCPSCASPDPICSLYGPDSPTCVKPSVKQSTLSEYKDFLPETDPPDGYTFIADGFARDETPDTIAVGTAPFLIDITIGSGGINVRAEGTTVTGTFVRDAADPERWIASGSIKVDVVKINGSGADPTAGDFTAMNLKQSEVDELEAFGHPIPTNLE